MQNLDFTFKTYLGGQNCETDDSFLYGDDFFILAEGIGGEYLSEVAKRTACRVIYDYFFKYLSEKLSPGDAIVNAIKEANISIIRERENVGKKMAASVSVVYIKERIMYFAHLGDSRIYTLSGDKINQLTRDHTVLEEDPDGIKKYGTSRLMHALTNGLGIHENPEINVKKYRLHYKDLIIMTSEGLTRRVTDRDILWVSKKSRNTKLLCNDLINLAIKKGGSNDSGEVTIGILKLGRFPREIRRIILIYILFFLFIFSIVGGYFIKYKKDDVSKVIKEDISQSKEKQAPQGENRQLETEKTSLETIDKKPILKNEINEQEIGKLFGTVLDFIGEWKFAWEMSAGESGDIETYISFYSRKFRTNRFNRESWKLDKARKNGKKQWIRVELADIKISGPDKDNFLEVRFFQNYKSSNYSSKGEKLLVLVKEGSSWKIMNERSY